MGVTTATASVVPAASPATLFQPKCNTLCCVQGHPPRNMPPTLVFPVFLFDNHPLYASKLAKRIAIFGTIPDKTAPRPLYKANGVSRRTIYAPVAKTPLGFVYTNIRQCGGQCYMNLPLEPSRSEKVAYGL